MTPAEHITAAEQALTAADNWREVWTEGERTAITLTAVGHALIALAVELGAPHAAAPSGGTNVSQ